MYSNIRIATNHVKKMQIISMELYYLIQICGNLRLIEFNVGLSITFSYTCIRMYYLTIYFTYADMISSEMNHRFLNQKNYKIITKYFFYFFL